MDITLPKSKVKSSEAEKTKGSSNEAIRKKIIFWDGVSIVLKSTGLVVWLIIFLLALLELKRYTHMDIIPGYDSAVDDVYGAIRGTITNAAGGER